MSLLFLRALVKMQMREATKQSVKMSKMKWGSTVFCSGSAVEEDSGLEADRRAVLCLHIWSMVRVELNCRPGGQSCRRSADSDMRRRWN